MGRVCGGYTDMVAQRGAGVSARTAAALAPASEKGPRPGAPTAAETGRKLSFKERHALETLPGLISAMERDMAKLSGVLAEPDLYARDRARYDKATAVLAELQAKHAASEEEWLRLEMLREEIEGG